MLIGVFSSYCLEKIISKGKIGKVFIASNTINNNKVVIKVIHKTGPRIKNKIERDSNIPNLLVHPNIVKILDFYEDEEIACIIYPYLPNSMPINKCFKNIIFRTDKIQLNYCIDLIIQICGAIQFMHSKYIVHRDIKPQNIIVSENIAILIDFDLASSLKDNRFKVRSGIIGSPHFIAPEIWKNEKNIDYITTDIYSLGVTFYYIFNNGKIPYYGKTIEEIEYRTRYDKPKLSNTGIPILDKLIMSVIEKNPLTRLNISQIIESLRVIKEK